MLAFNKTTLPNGLRILSIPQPESPSTTVMVIVGVGSRFETAKEAGISHFIEHNVFKGTTKRPHTNQVSHELEAIGGLTDAATGHEYTYFLTKCPPQNTSQALEMIVDITLNMTFPAKDIEIEKGNVIQEINMNEDDPRMKIVHDYNSFVWGGHAMGRHIYGSKETVSSFKRDDLLQFVGRNYTTENMLVVVSGAYDEEKLVGEIHGFFGEIKKKNAPTFESYTEFQTEPRVFVDNQDTQQAHLCLGWKSYGRFHPDRFALDLLETHMGRGLSSRLFNRIREELGLAYYIHANNWEYDEAGVLFAWAGVENGRVDEAITAIIDEFSKLKTVEVTESDLNRAKQYLSGRIVTGVESSDAVGEWYAFQVLMDKEVLSPQQYVDKIMSVTAKDLMRIANDIIHPKNLNLGIIGPFSDKKRFEDLVGSRDSRLTGGQA